MEKNEVSFGNFIKSRRKQKKIRQGELSEGLFDRSLLGKIERGEYYPDKLLCDRLLGRLGESGCDYECFLQRSDYKHWKERQNMLNALEEDNLPLAEKLLDAYYKNRTESGVLAEQFWSVMKIQWLEQKGISDCKELLKKAIELTIPCISQKPLNELLLSIQELNLVLEYMEYTANSDKAEGYHSLFAYIENHEYDAESMAMMYPKLVLRYGVFLKDFVCSEAGTFCRTLVDNVIIKCERALDYLGVQQRAYFVWELLSLQNEYLRMVLQKTEILERDVLQSYRLMLERNDNFLKLFEQYCTNYGCDKRTKNFICFYREHEVYCINDVIRTRRIMNHIPASSMDRICGRRTLQRLESVRGNTNVQVANAKGLFCYLNLSSEMYRAQIVSDNREAIILEKQFRIAMNQKKYSTAEEILLKLKEMISLNYKINQQYICYEEAFLAYKKNKNTREEFIQSAKSALEITIPYEIALGKIEDSKLKNGRVRLGEKYLTNVEITILANLASLIGNVPDNPYWYVLKEYFENLEEKVSVIPVFGMYGFVMSSVARYMRNRGCFEEASKLSEKILVASLITRDLGYMERCIYGIAWSEREQGQPDRGDLAWKQAMEDCLTVDLFCKDEYRVQKRKSDLQELKRELL